ncbi:MAG: hypothetical protein ACNI3C_06525 [Candidatus Marinarcus sp.]|uniref:hypothetical protein n=1 Tax=Candidatus Marinarcus sp. TaxID=3100987 RepID=UPI003B000214
MKPFTLFSTTLFAILFIYTHVLGEVKTIQLIVDEFWFILALFPFSLLLFYSKYKVKHYEVTIPVQTMTFKTSVIFFLFFEVIDYFNQDGFEGMISQWFFYWIMGLLSLCLIETVTNFKIYKLSQLKKPQ